MNARAVLLLTGLVLALAGCGAEGPGAGPAGASPAGEWTLVSGATTVPGYPITLEVVGGEVRGRAACNTYRGAVSIGGAGFTVGDLARTEMGCPQPGVHDSESEFLDRLATVDRWQLESDRLILSGRDAQLVFDPVAPAPDAPLEGTWRVESLVTGGGPDGVASSTVAPAHITLAADGTFSANDGCNELQGGWAADDGVLRFADIITTDAACPEGVSAQAEHIAAVLQAWPTVQVNGNSMALGAGDLGLHLRAD